VTSSVNARAQANNNELPGQNALNVVLTDAFRGGAG